LLKAKSSSALDLATAEGLKSGRLEGSSSQDLALLRGGEGL
jgi:hypothetical protein